MSREPKRKVLTVVMDGVGDSSKRFGNAVLFARTPWLGFLKQEGIYTQLAAHGTAVGLPSDADIGNSEVGHNALGAGRVFDQGAKLVQNAIDSGLIFASPVWQKMVAQVRIRVSTLHFIGLLSDGNVHAHEAHLHNLIRRAKAEGVQRVRVHPLLDGRDVGEKSAEVYVERLERLLLELNDDTFDARVGSGGGRMTTTMDRYEADWSIVQRGWQAHVHGEAAYSFPSLSAAVRYFRGIPDMTDQNFPAFVIADESGPLGKIVSGDAVVFFNFRGDRAIEISRAFEDEVFDAFPRGPRPDVMYAGMMQYDGDLFIPKNFLVTPPAIADTMGEYLVSEGRKQFACSETQKYGHVTYFWNGNRSGKFSDSLETYIEVPSDVLSFDLKPWMKAHEITEEAIKAMETDLFDFGRINYANGDMVGHTGNFAASVVAVATVDLMIGRLISAAKRTKTILVVTADHGNCDEMFDARQEDFPTWETDLPYEQPKPRTSHTLNPVPFLVFDPLAPKGWKLRQVDEPGLANVAATCLTLMGETVPAHFLPSLVGQA